MTQTILLIDDEVTVCEVMRKYLERENFTVLEAQRGQQAMALLCENQVDLMVLDVMLPEIEGFSLLRQLRAADEGPLSQNREVPVIMLTARIEEHDRLTGFELGADDYVVKPFSPLELVYRIRAVLRRFAPPQEEHNIIRYDDLEIDPDKRSVIRDGLAISLTTKEFDILYLLAQHPLQVFSREQLLNKVWGYDFYGGQSTVTVHVRRLREKLEPNPTTPSYIHTVWGVGYKFEPR